MKYTLTIQEVHFEELYKLVIQEDDKERPAIMLCGVSDIHDDLWDGGREVRFLSKYVFAIPDEYITHHNSNEVEWNTEIFRKALKIAKEEELQVCIVHSHPLGYIKFSEVDDKNEIELFKIIVNRNRTSIPNLSLIITKDKSVIARVCTSSFNFHPIELIRILGHKFNFIYQGRFSYYPKEEFHRQQLAFGKSLNSDLAKLRIGIVGCGATGSATANLLARLGVGQLLLIDNDLVERSNLSRLQGATSADADIGRSKAVALAEHIAKIGIGCRVRYVQNWASDNQCRDAIKSCDIIFGCTDDNSGRIFLNRLAFFYLIPVFDMGIVIDLAEDDSNKLEALLGRMTVILPGNTCLICRSIVNINLAREEQLKRTDPAGFDRQKEEAYVTGEANPSPAVITFTSEVASMSVNEFINRLTGFKKYGPENHVVRFFDKGIDRRQSVPPNLNCPICGNLDYWGKGDIKPFMDFIN